MTGVKEDQGDRRKSNKRKRNVGSKKSSLRLSNRTKEMYEEVGLFYDKWRCNQFRYPQFRLGTRGEGNILHSPAPVVSAAMAYKIFGPIALMSTYCLCIRKVFAAIRRRIQAFWSGV
ncbi:hypothetical protein TNCV_1961471 [Trichonephila clavipes]|nr:hypothetical protein TNCV_1961471 [Trichonephila clavipes]